MEWTKSKVTLKGIAFNDPVLVEPITGRVFALDRYHYSPNNPDRTYALYLWDSPVFLMERSAFDILEDDIGEAFRNEF